MKGISITSNTTSKLIYFEGTETIYSFLPSYIKTYIYTYIRIYIHAFMYINACIYIHAYT